MIHEISPNQSLKNLVGGFRFVFNTHDWWKTILLQGLISLIPIVGCISLLGWQKRLCQGIHQGMTGLPEVGLGKYLKLGLAPFVAVILLGLIALVLSLPLILVNETDALMTGVSLVFAGLYGRIMPRVLLSDTPWDELVPKSLFQRPFLRPGSFGGMMLGILVAALIIVSSFITLYVGIFFTNAAAQAYLAYIFGAHTSRLPPATNV